MNDLLLSCLEGPSSKITILVGENGAGKSRRLSALASDLITADRRVIAIANTVFDRFPRVRKATYMRLSPSIGRSYAKNVFKRALLAAPEETLRNASLIGKTLEYTGFEPVIGLHIRINQNWTHEDELDKLLYREMPSDDASTVRRALKIYKDYKKERQSAWIDMYGSQIGPDRREIITLLKHELKLKRIGLISGISITLGKQKSFYDLDDASSGELTLLASYAYIATHIKEGDTILIDEPENSLHPRWQREYCRRLLDQFYYHEPKLVLATHSPLIIQGAETSGVDVEILKAPFDQPTNAALTRSIEGTLFEAFGVLSPASHYLSEKVADILNELIQKRSSVENAQAALEELIKISDDQAQRDFLNRAIDLALQVEFLVKQPRGNQ